MGKTQRNVLSTGFLHQQSAAHGQVVAPMASTNRPMTAKSRYTIPVPIKSLFIPAVYDRAARRPDETSDDRVAVQDRCVSLPDSG